MELKQPEQAKEIAPGISQSNLIGIETRGFVLLLQSHQNSQSNLIGIETRKFVAHGKARAFSQSNLIGIETIQTNVCVLPAWPLNRTLLELKQAIATFLPDAYVTLNRTLLELKPDGGESLLAAKLLSIEPYWN